MGLYKLLFSLKQHTPLIHFQSNQAGATLRATELKPKLDTYLMANCTDLPYKKHPNGAKSLDYKVTIRTSGNRIEDIEKLDQRGKEQKDPLFFGNMGDGEKKKFVTSDKLEIEFSTFSIEIKKAIEDKFESFIALTNFGTRQSKGFGSFYLDKPFDASLIPYKVYSFSSNNWKNDVKLLYAFLRQGINYPNANGTRFYSKPAIFSYMMSKNVTWDKKAIKQHFFPDPLRLQQGKYASDSPTNFNGKQELLVRDLFGLSSDQRWMSYSADIKKEHDDIDRFKSPLTFKIVGNKVYFWADKSVEKLLNQTFKISAKGNKPLMLSTPAEFDFEDFFNFAFSIDLSKHINPSYHTQNEYTSLLRMFKEIKGAK